MRVLRVRFNGHSFYARLDGNHVYCLNPQLGLEQPISLEEITVLPVVTPSKIVCMGMNFKDHAEEIGFEIPSEPVFFLKPPSSVIGSGQAIVLPVASQRVDHEAELGIVIGRAARNITPEDVPTHIFGYTCANDVTARDLQQRDGLFGRCKGFDTFAPVGPWIETEVADPSDLVIRAVVNGEVRQEGHTADMIFSPHEVVAAISQVMTLLPGDLVLTGTPKGVSPIQDGDDVRVEIEGVGLLINPALRESGDDVPEEGAGEIPVQ
ncbi:fumarylacetoacetate hydrolase family protein [Oleidesulfovibrio sp.]|uniref:fumarylacetoacetate hydrolase family protein n=1 Tax=Oleidesulfovibrio sp. TaxID=2909707 RepID=UPI003A8C1F2A